MMSSAGGETKNKEKASLFNRPGGGGKDGGGTDKINGVGCPHPPEKHEGYVAVVFHTYRITQTFKIAVVRSFLF
jgi:hypothetical protein